MGALLVPLAILVGASFDSVTKAPDAVANVLEGTSTDEPRAVVVATPDAVPVGPQRSVGEPEAPGAVVAAPPVQHPAVAAPQQTISEALGVERCVAADTSAQKAPKEPPGASMSVDVLPGRSGPHRDGHEESRPGRPVRCG